MVSDSQNNHNPVSIWVCVVVLLMLLSGWELVLVADQGNEEHHENFVCM